MFASAIFAKASAIAGFAATAFVYIVLGVVLSVAAVSVVRMVRGSRRDAAMKKVSNVEAARVRAAQRHNARLAQG